MKIWLFLPLLALPPFLERKTDQPPEAPPDKTEETEAPEVVEELPPPEPPPPQAPPMWGEPLPLQIHTLPEGLANLSSQGCNACHGTIHDEWRDSEHQRGWSEPVFVEALAATNDFPLCQSCHLPLANQQSVLLKEYLGGDFTTAELLANPSWDPTLQGEGVNCVSCHVRDGFVVSTAPAPSAPHPVAVSEELGNSEFCGACHQMSWPGEDRPFYDTWGEWSRSPWATANVSCQDCHMESASGGPTLGTGHGHLSHQMVSDTARAVSVLVNLESPTLTRGQEIPVEIILQNTGAGHNFPTGSPFKSVLLEVLLKDQSGAPLGPGFQHVLQRKVEEKAPYHTLMDTTLPSGESRSFDFVLSPPIQAKPGDVYLEVSLSRVHSSETKAPPLYLQQIPCELE